METPHLREVKTNKIRVFEPEKISNDEIISEGTHYERIKEFIVVNKAEEFFRLYTRIQGIIFDLSETGIKTFLAICISNFGKENKVYLVKSLKQELATTVKTSLPTIEKGIKELVDKKLLQRIATSTYLINPDLVYSKSDKDREREIAYGILLKYNTKTEDK